MEDPNFLCFRVADKLNRANFSDLSHLWSDNVTGVRISDNLPKVIIKILFFGEYYSPKIL